MLIEGVEEGPFGFEPLAGREVRSDLMREGREWARRREGTRGIRRGKWIEGERKRVEEEKGRAKERSARIQTSTHRTNERRVVLVVSLSVSLPKRSSPFPPHSRSKLPTSPLPSPPVSPHPPPHVPPLATPTRLYSSPPSPV